MQTDQMPPRLSFIFNSPETCHAHFVSTAKHSRQPIITDQALTPYFLQHFMDPKSVALIGISRKSGPGSFNLMEIMSDFGYSGEIYPVNPNAGEILGKKAYPSVTAVKKKVSRISFSSALKTSCIKHAKRLT